MKRRSSSQGGERERDFPKRRRKLGKQKQAPENATSITFKTKAVILPSQLRPTTEPTTHRKVPLQTLLNQLHHFKLAVRSEALSGLRGLFQEHPALLLPNLDKLVLHVMLTLTDAEPAVRAALLLLLGSVFPKIASASLMPFFSTLEAHLCCGFTHISDQIQLDTLKVFEVVLCHFPELLVPYASKQLPMLLNLISRQDAGLKSSSGSEASARKPSAVLSIQPASKLTLKSSRIKIFSLMCAYFEAVLQASGERIVSASHCVDVMAKTVLRMTNGKLEEVHSTVCDFSGPIPHIPVVQTYGIEIPPHAFLDTPVSTRHLALFPSKEEFVEFAQNLFSLIIESWVECSSLLTSSPLPLAALSLLCLLVRTASHVEQQEQPVEPSSEDASAKSVTMLLFERHWTDFSKHIMAGFPYTAAEGDDPMLMKLNATVCHTALLLLPRSTSPRQPHPASLPTLDTVVAVCQYIAGATSREQLSSTVQQSLAKTLVKVLPMILRFSSLSSATLKRLLGGVWRLYSCAALPCKQALIPCFSKLHSDVFTGEISNRVVLSELLSPWLQTLPALLVELSAVSSSSSQAVCVVDSIAAAVVHRNPALLESLQENFERMIGAESVFPSLPVSSQRRLLGLLWYIPRPPLGALLCCARRLPPSLTTYTTQLLHQRLVGSDGVTAAQTSVAQHLSFLLSLAAGYSRAVLEEQLKRQPAAERSLLMLCDPLHTVSLADRAVILNSVCGCVTAASFLPDALAMLESPLETLLGGHYCKLPVDTAVGLLKLAECCLSSPECVLSTKLIELLSTLCLAGLVALATSTSFEATSLVSYCGQLTNEVLCSSRPLLCAVLVQFRQSWSYDTAVFGPWLRAQVFVCLLKSSLFAATLSGCRQEVASVRRQLLMVVSQDDSSTSLQFKNQLELAAAANFI